MNMNPQFFAIGYRPRVTQNRYHTIVVLAENMAKAIEKARWLLPPESSVSVSYSRGPFSILEADHVCPFGKTLESRLFPEDLKTLQAIYRQALAAGDLKYARLFKRFADNASYASGPA